MMNPAKFYQNLKDSSTRIMARVVEDKCDVHYHFYDGTYSAYISGFSRGGYGETRESALQAACDNIALYARYGRASVK